MRSVSPYRILLVTAVALNLPQAFVWMLFLSNALLEVIKQPAQVQWAEWFSFTGLTLVWMGIGPTVTIVGLVWAIRKDGNSVSTV